MARACAKSNNRLRWVVVPPLRSIEESVKEMKTAKDNGAVGVFFRGIEGNLTLDNPYFFSRLPSGNGERSSDLHSHRLWNPCGNGDV
jgi:hypothetical protein